MAGEGGSVATLTGKVLYVRRRPLLETQRRACKTPAGRLGPSDPGPTATWACAALYFFYKQLSLPAYLYCIYLAPRLKNGRLAGVVAAARQRGRRPALHRALCDHVHLGHWAAVLLRIYGVHTENMRRLLWFRPVRMRLRLLVSPTNLLHRRHDVPAVGAQDGKGVRLRTARTADSASQSAAHAAT